MGNHEVLPIENAPVRDRDWIGYQKWYLQERQHGERLELAIAIATGDEIKESALRKSIRARRRSGEKSLRALDRRTKEMHRQ